MDAKLRGRKHHNNKARYKNKSKVVLKDPENALDESDHEDTASEQFRQKQRLESNWSRYEKREEENSGDFTNFGMLAQAPISCGGHFQFKDDKNLQAGVDLDEFRSNKLFALDLFMLERSLNCIPFHERCGLQEEYLTTDQLEEINERACQNQVWYDNYLKEFEEDQKEENQAYDEKDIKRDELDKVKELTLDVCSQGTVEPQKNVTQYKARKMSEETKESQEELEEWLDDILNT